MSRSDPSALRWLIGNELRQYRIQAGETVSSVGKALKCSHAKITHLETGRYHQQPEDIAALLKLYGAERHDIERLTSLAGSSNSRSWWAPWANVVPDWLKTFVGLEGLADSEFSYDSFCVPGLLQTDAYARALTVATDSVRRDHAERFVNFRLRQAQRLLEGEPLKLHAVIEEAALVRHVGSAEVRQAQYGHLLQMAALPNVTIQVARPTNGPHNATIGQFVVLEFSHVRPVAYVELLDGAVYVQDPDEVETYKMAADDVARVALSADESLRFIERLADSGAENVRADA